jgi:hypothetical protein
MAQEVAGHLGNQPSAQVDNGFCQQAFDISTGIPDLLKDAFDALPDTAQPAIQIVSVLNVLVGTTRRPDQGVGLIEDLGLPF